MKKILSVFFIFFVFSTELYAASKTEIILDVSGSMNKMLGSEKRIEAARKAIALALAGTPDDAIVALRLYSHRISPRDKVASCKDTELVVPFGPVNKPLIQTIVNAAQPLGETPIAYSLEQAALDFGAVSDEQAVIILVSDGEESCGGDPIATARALVARGFKVKIHTIGIDVDAPARAQLEGLSTATGGTYKDARDAASLSSSLQELTKDALVVKKQPSTYGDAIRGGDSYETAVSLNPGKLYRLDHHQKKDQYDYFYIDLKGGQRLLAKVETGEDGVSIDSTLNQATITKGNPYAGIAIHSSQRQQIGRADIIGGRNEKKALSFAVPSSAEGRYYVLVGSIYDAQNKDHRFQVDIQDMSDANSGRDAGDTEATALEIQAGQYDKNFLSVGDNLDIFKFNPISGTSYEIKARSSKPEISLDIVLTDVDGVQVAETYSPNGGAVAKFDHVSFQKAGPVFIKIREHFSSGTDEIPYSFSVLPVGTGGQDLTATSQPANNTVSSPPLVPSIPGPGFNPTPTHTLPIPVLNKTTIQPLSMGLVFSQMGGLEKGKWILMYVLCPSFSIFLFGLLFGYVWGRRSGKRKAIAQLQKAQAQTQSQKVAPPAPPVNTSFK
ncbi:MAG: VWA domain-containing protein [Deltaproteobacteria bacterium]|nr:VWA domain-containing protein [Deltaproteobacteria bacterium]